MFLTIFIDYLIWKHCFSGKTCRKQCFSHRWMKNTKYLIYYCGSKAVKLVFANLFPVHVRISAKMKLWAHNPRRMHSRRFALHETKIEAKAHAERMRPLEIHNSTGWRQLAQWCGRTRKPIHEPTRTHSYSYMKFACAASTAARGAVTLVLADRSMVVNYHHTHTHTHTYT